MDKISELRNLLSEVFTWNKSRIDCLSKMLVAMIIVRTVNLREIAVAFSSHTSEDSRYKRLKRFFAHFKMDYVVLARWLFNLFYSKDDKVYLSLDRTNWYWGKSKINVFVLSVTYEGIAIPVFWELLDKAGNASAQEHIDLISRFIRYFNKSCIVGVLGDREFASSKLFAWCINQNIPFYIRIKDNAEVTFRNGSICSARDLFNKLNLKEQMTSGSLVSVYKCKIYLSASRSERGELMVVATNQPPKNAIAIYLRRWEIECLFSCLKGRGFRFESTHITQPDRIKKLVGVLAIAFCWAHKVGEWRNTCRPIKMNKYKDAKRPQYSYFRYGLNLLRDNVINQFTSDTLTACINILRCSTSYPSICFN